MEMSKKSPLNSKQERKRLRREQRDLSDELVMSKEDLEKTSSDTFTRLREKNNALNKQIVHAREALNDTQNVKVLAKAVKNAAGHLDDVSRRYDYASFAASLTADYNRGRASLFSWVDFGRDVGVLFRRKEQMSTMFGPIDKEVTVRASNREDRARQIEHSEQVLAQVVKQTDEDEESEATNLRVQHLYEVIREQENFDLLDLLVDRKDPVQTVENFFDFSFLVKEKRASQEVVKGGDSTAGLLLSRPLDPQRLAADRQAKQHVLSIPMEDMRVVAELLSEIDDLERQSNKEKPLKRLREEMPERNILHRDDPLYTAESASHQASIIAEQAKQKHSQGCKTENCDKKSLDRKKRVLQRASEGMINGNAKKKKK